MSTLQRPLTATTTRLFRVTLDFHPCTSIACFLDSRRLDVPATISARYASLETFAIPYMSCKGVPASHSEGRWAQNHQAHILSQKRLSTRTFIVVILGIYENDSASWRCAFHAETWDLRRFTCLRRWSFLFNDCPQTLQAYGLACNSCD